MRRQLPQVETGTEPCCSGDDKAFVRPGARSQTGDRFPVSCHGQKACRSDKLSIAGGAQSSSDFPIGLAFSQTFDVLKSSFWRFLVISAIPIVAFFVAGFEGARGAAVIAGIATVLGVLLNFILQSVIVYGAIQEMRGRGFDFAEAAGH